MKIFTLFPLQKSERKWVLSDKTIRSFVKTISWRFTGSGATFVISYFISGNLVMASSIATIQLVANTILYFLHERIWNNISWGRIAESIKKEN
jgi:uncharacterized membrane protein